MEYPDRIKYVPNGAENELYDADTGKQLEGIYDYEINIFDITVYFTKEIKKMYLIQSGGYYTLGGAKI